MDRNQAKKFWNEIYLSKSEQQVSWFSESLKESLEQILKHAPEKNSRIIDVGSGRSTLANDLLRLGYESITILDISDAAIMQAVSKIDANFEYLKSIVGDVTNFEFSRESFDLWHDRAVFHFLTSKEKKKAYIDALKNSLRPNGTAVISTFENEGPEKCSGLKVQRYDEKSLSVELGSQFRLLEWKKWDHLTPFGVRQRFIQCCYALKP